jgi:hypothetical protein
MLGFDPWVPFICDVVAAGLSMFIVYSMLRLVRVVRREYLLGFPIGFTLLTIGFIAFGVSYAFPGLEELASWLHLSLVTCGFAFIAGTYFLKKKSLWKRVGVMSAWLFSILVVLAVAAVILIVVPPRFLLPSYRGVDEIFRTTDLVLLIYIIHSLYQDFKPRRIGLGGMVLTGFVLLVGNQYSLLLWGLDDGFWSFALAHAMGLAGLAMLATALSTGFQRA